MTTHDRHGVLTIDGDRATMTFRRHLPHPIEAVWAALTDPAERKAWFGETTIDARTGGTIEMMPDEPPAAPDAKRLTGRILVWDPPHVLEHEWHQRIVEDSIVRYELTPDGEGTLLTFTHRPLPHQRPRLPPRHPRLPGPPGRPPRQHAPPPLAHPVRRTVRHLPHLVLTRRSHSRLILTRRLPPPPRLVLTSRPTPSAPARRPPPRLTSCPATTCPSPATLRICPTCPPPHHPAPVRPSPRAHPETPTSRAAGES
ncbi:SRPBCC family protein [Kribbella sp. CA-247076]|uniref:SRPBCC family protein n=1 Tax=Kribbella sp. CA-247076 TaxID=3239941 RepID=UPI003D8F6E21